MPQEWKWASTALRAAAFWVVAAGLWLLCTGSWKRDESILGVIVTLASTIFALAVFGQYEHPLDFRLRDLAQFWRAPIYFVVQVGSITWLLIKDLFGPRLPSLYRVCPFERRNDDALARSRRVLATAYTTTAPNFIVIGIDAERREMLFHQIERTKIPAMTKALGAQP